MFEVLKRFCKIGEIEHDKDVPRYLKIMEQLRENLNHYAWDGAWYQRAYFENGTAIGTHESEECKIDSISQSWAVISGAGDVEKGNIAMENLENHLVDRENMMIKLLTPAFHRTELNPGYIKSYIPGVRENGGQYTHGAVWAILASAKIRNGQKAMEYFHFLNPIEHAATKERAVKYKVEPYVVVADIYASPQMIGRGGWTWYTGSSSWLFCAGLEGILGIQKEGDALKLNPCIPSDWESFSVSFQFEDTSYQINVYQQDSFQHQIFTIYQDNNLVTTNQIHLINDKMEHRIDVIMG